ncbi:MAG TPA: YeeE/YedE thiosulfate transporter family protein, partial [Burkholderiaceae bacterium]|nr:YeeE/YedE thiosulfate transporter family protein [Burkholderiaceae bacterium]
MAGKALLVIALLIGMLVSAVQRQSFALRLPRPREFFLCLAGGLLMGLGAALLPGGNDTLLLTALPSLSIFALANYIALLAGIASALLLLRRTRPNEPQHVKNPNPPQPAHPRTNL